MSEKKSNSLSIITVESLKAFFFNELDHINRNSLCPVPQETIFYSSGVLEKYSLSDAYFSQSDGKIREKILGEMYLTAQHKGQEEQKRIFREIGDTALFLCGFFSDAINKKLVDRSYYLNLGISAYQRMNYVEPRCLDIPSFYSILATSFETLTHLIATTSRKLHNNQNNIYELILSTEMDSRELLIHGILPGSDKAS
jgi:hypothetical protein